MFNSSPSFHLIRCLGVVLSCLISLSLRAAPALIEVNGSENGRAITAYGEVLEDSTQQLNLAQVYQTTSGWETGPAVAFVFGFSSSAYWVRWKLTNQTATPLTLFVDLGNPRQDYVNWYVIRAQGTQVSETLSGDRLPYAQRPVKAARNFVLPISFDSHESLELYVRLDSQDGLYEAMPFEISNPENYVAEADLTSLILTFYFGGLLSLALYNLLLYVSGRERSFGLYVGYMLSILLWNFTFSGYGFQYLWPNSMAFNNNILTVAAAWSFGIFGLFTVEYLQLRTSVPRWLLRLNQMFAWLNLAVTLPAALDFYALGAGMGQATGVAMAVVSLGTGIWLLFKGQRQARFFVGAFALLGLGASAYILQVVGLVPPNVLTTWGLQMGSALESLLLALGLADAMNTLKQQRLQAEREAREAQVALNTQLELLVSERTQALEDANRKLQTLAETDELTGAFNRRYFNTYCAASLAQRTRLEPLVLCMFDIDYFKQFNDRYGHQAGDEALKAVAGIIRSALKRSSDALFRLGGEEFGVLFSANSQEAALAFVECLRVKIRDLNIPHADNHVGVVTASFGVCWCDLPTNSHVSVDQMYTFADKALYSAKAAGRNDVALISLA